MWINFSLELREVFLNSGRWPLRSNTNGTSSPCKSRVEGEVMGSQPIGCMCDSPIKRENRKKNKRKKIKEKQGRWNIRRNVFYEPDGF